MVGCIVAPLRVVGSTLRDYLRIDRYIGTVIVLFVLLFVPLIPRATDNPQMLASASNDDPWMAMALEATLAKPYGNPSNYFDPKASAHEHIPPHWGHLRYGYDNIVYYGGSVFALADSSLCGGAVGRAGPLPDGADHSEEHLVPGGAAKPHRSL